MSAVALSALELLPMVTLEEIQSEAPLQTRIDRKYLLPAEALEAVIAACAQSLRVLEIAGERSFGYRSTYFDTPDLVAYRAAATGRRPRFKVRTRRYLATGSTWLEVKARDRHDRTDKHRIEFASEAQFDPEAAAFLSHFDGVRPHVAQLRPSLVTTYERATLLSTSTASVLAEQRVTIDRDVHCRMPGRSSAVGIGRHLIVETKSPDHRPGSFDRALWRAGVRPVRISKYALGIAAGHPELPANRWSRVIRRYAQPVSPSPALNPSLQPSPHLA